MADRYALFRSVAPAYMAKSMHDFDWVLDDAAACFGNLGHESGGFTMLQEAKPLVPGSLGGWGWAQWTGARRVNFENYCRRNGLDPKAHDTQYKFLFVELTGPEKAAVPATRNAGRDIKDPDARLMVKVRAFELNFERAHKDYKHYDSRLTYAKIARQAFLDAEKAGKVAHEPPVVQQPQSPVSQPESRVSALARIFNTILNRKG